MYKQWFLLLFGLACAAGSAKADDRPNIVLVLADDLGFSDVGVYGSEIATPTIDALAERGISFTNFHTAASCAPSRHIALTIEDHSVPTWSPSRSYFPMEAIAPTWRVNGTWG